MEMKGLLFTTANAESYPHQSNLLHQKTTISNMQHDAEKTKCHLIFGQEHAK
jgi:hypothetical protein